MVAMSPWPSMPKPTTGLPVLAMPSTTRLGPAVLDADHDHGGDVGIGAGADQRAEMQVEVGAELQAAVGMRDGQRALDVVGDRLAGGVRQVVERQDDDVVAHADPAVLAPPAVETQVALALGALAVGLRGHCRFRSPALGLEVLDVDVLAHAGVGDHAADVLAVLDDGVALLERLERDLVADRDVLLGVSLRVVSFSVTTPSMSVPAFRPSTTTTPTLSFGLWTRKCGAGTLLPPC